MIQFNRLEAFVRFSLRLSRVNLSALSHVTHLGLAYLLDHADHQALLESAELATVSPALVHRTGSLGQAHVFGALLHGPLEEALATLAGAHAVMLTGRGVAAHGAKLARTRGCAFAAGAASGRR